MSSRTTYCWIYSKILHCWFCNDRLPVVARGLKDVIMSDVLYMYCICWSYNLSFSKQRSRLSILRRNSYDDEPIQGLSSHWKNSQTKALLSCFFCLAHAFSIRLCPSCGLRVDLDKLCLGLWSLFTTAHTLDQPFTTNKTSTRCCLWYITEATNGQTFVVSWKQWWWHQHQQQCHKQQHRSNFRDQSVQRRAHTTGNNNNNNNISF